jgi:hypothetical protein
VAALLCAGVLGYGLVRGPPAPIRQAQDGYRDRFGNRYTAEEFARFARWERVLLATVASTFIVGFAWLVIGRKQRRSGELSPRDREKLESAVDRIEQVFPDAAAELRARGPLAQPGTTNPDPDETGQAH